MRRERLTVRSLAPSDTDAISTWRYPGRDSTYDVKHLVTAEHGYWAVARGEELVGYCCFGLAARVPGVDEEEGTLDVGYGLRPDLVGQGLGRAFVLAILGFAGTEFAPVRFRLLILHWNRRSQKVATALGFEEERLVTSDEGRFHLLTRPADGRPSGR